VSRSTPQPTIPADADLGATVSYLTLKEGTPVYDRSGRRIGVVEEIVADTRLDIFDGLIIHTDPLPGRHLLAKVDQIAELHERGVLLSAASHELAPARRPRGSDEDVSPEGRLHALLRRGLDRLLGR
jgi:hypothetical protein